MLFRKNPITEGMEDAYHVKRSPFFEGFQRGMQASLIGIPIGAIANLARGKSPLLGAIAGGLVTGVPVGLASAAAQKLSNLDQEAMIRYHSARIKEREPLFFMPPPNHLHKVFAPQEVE